MLDGNFTEKVLNYSHNKTLIFGRHEAIADSIPNH